MLGGVVRWSLLDNSFEDVPQLNVKNDCYKPCIKTKYVPVPVRAPHTVCILVTSINPSQILAPRLP
jgi:hypothetical protein